MPLTKKGEKIMKNFKEEYGEEKGEKYFYAARNSGRIEGVDRKDSAPKHRSDTSKDCSSYMDACRRGDAVDMARAHGKLVR